METGTVPVAGRDTQPPSIQSPGQPQSSVASAMVLAMSTPQQYAAHRVGFGPIPGLQWS
jgi:hypothetical protein